MVEARNFKFGTETDGSECFINERKMQNWVKRGHVKSRFLEFWDPLIFRERLIEGRHFKFGTWTDGSEY